MATEKKEPKEKGEPKGKGEVRVEVLTRIRTGREKREDGSLGKPIYVEVGEETTMAIEEAETAEVRGVVKILEGRKAREAAKNAE